MRHVPFLSGTLSTGTYFFVAHNGATRKCTLKASRLSAAGKTDGKQARERGLKADFVMDSESDIFYRQLPKVVMLWNVGLFF